MSSRFTDLDFEGFKALARDPDLSRHEKVGFPDAYRSGRDRAIVRDVASKLTNLRARRRTVVDIGAGCGDLAIALIELCATRGHRLHVVDSAEMLDHLPAAPHVEKHSGRFPDDCGGLLDELSGKVDAVLVYSVIQYVFVERSVFAFLDRALALVAPGGQLLVGDVPNESMRRRFFESEAGARFHRRFTGTAAPPPLRQPVADPGLIDDAVVLALLQRARTAGFHAFVVPQRRDLPMANRREDLLFLRP